MRYCKRPWGFAFADTKAPRVMYAACWRKDEDPRRERVSIGIPAWEAAKTAFIVGMYCSGAESDTDRTRMRACRPGRPWFRVGRDLGPERGVGLEVADVGEAERDRAVLLMWQRALVRAPEMRVVVGCTSEGVVASIRDRREVRREDSIRANWGNLSAEAVGVGFFVGASVISTSSLGPFIASVGFGGDG